VVGEEDPAVMSVLVLLITAGGIVASGFLAAFVWAVRAGQFDDLWTPAIRVLLDTRKPPAIERSPSAVTRHEPLSVRNHHSG
jgi:cbb3-type cytochrome oxidase maturation protein